MSKSKIRAIPTKLFTGGTGCGKTYRAIKGSDSFVLAVPCRQLANEIYMDYPEIDRIDTGEVHLGDPRSDKQVCVYENLSDEVIDQRALIVDEAHYLNDPERGGALFQKILLNRAAGKEIVLLTATDTISDTVKRILQVEETVLEPFVEPPTKVAITVREFSKKVRAGMSSIVFVKYTPTDETRVAYAKLFGISESAIRIVSADTPSFERFQIQLDFKHGRIPVIIATNVLAQGLNFPAQGVLVEYNEWDDWEIVTQKIGRVARPLYGHTKGYYCLSQAIPEQEIKRGVPELVLRPAVQYCRPSNAEIDITDWGFMEHEVPGSLTDYREYKYSARFLRELRRRVTALEVREQQALAFLDNQARLLRGLLMTREAVEQFA
jgi:hypothetical protein